MLALALTLLLSLVPAVGALDDGLGLLPPLGWNSDNYFGDDFPNYCLCDGIVAPLVRPAWLDKFYSKHHFRHTQMQNQSAGASAEPPPPPHSCLLW